MLVSVSSRSGSFSRPILALVKTLWNKNKKFPFTFYFVMTMFQVFSRTRLLTTAAPACLDLRLAVQCSWCAVCTMPSCGHVSLPSCCHATIGFQLYYGSHVTKVDTCLEIHQQAKFKGEYCSYRIEHGPPKNFVAFYNQFSLSVQFIFNRKVAISFSMKWFSDRWYD